MPNLDTPCTVTKIIGTADGGEPMPGAIKHERCAIIKLLEREEKIPVQADDLDPSAAPQELVDAVLLLPISTTANISDMLEVAGVKLRVTSVSPSRDVVGKLDHHVVQAMKWE